MELRLSIIIEKLQEKGIFIENKQKKDHLIQNAVYASMPEDFVAKDISSKVWVFDKRNEMLLEVLKKRGNRSGFCYICCDNETGESEKIIQIICENKFLTWNNVQRNNLYKVFQILEGNTYL